MKKLTFTALIIFISIGAYAQFEQGTIAVGGSLSADFTGTKTKFGGTTNTLSHSTSFSMGPQLGYFIIDNLSLGASITVESEAIKYEGSSDKDSQSTLLFSPIVRYYLEQGIFFQGRADVGSAKFKDQNGNTTTTTNYGASGGALSVGYAIFLADNVALEPQLGYGSLGYKNKSNDAKLIESGLFIRLGFMIYLKK